jgi:hypothetical protein
MARRVGEQKANIKTSLAYTRLMPKAYWKIEGFDGVTKIYDRKVALSQFSYDQVQALLKALVAKAGLSLDEVVGAYARRRSKIANDLLEVHRDGQHPVFLCGSNPHFVARVIHEQPQTRKATV